MFIIHGVDGNSGTINIYQDGTAGSKTILTRGSTQTFTMTLKEDIGDIYSLRIWHDNSGKDPSWYLDEIEITDTRSGNCWKFIFETWLSLEDESYTNEVLQTPLHSNRNITRKAIKEMFSNGHLWLSIITKIPNDSFTRVQRLSFCFALLLCTMATNAAFYSWGAQSPQNINLGPLKFSARQAIVSIQANLILLPLQVLILLFKNTLARLQVERKRLCLICITSILIVIMTTASAALTISYGLVWGKDKSQEWISAVIASVFEDILIVQPFKCVIIVSLTVMLSKCKATKVSSYGLQQTPLEKASTRSREKSSLRKESVVKAKRRLSIRQAIFYVTFLVVLGVLSYGNRDSNGYHLTRSLYDHIGNFAKVQGHHSRPRLLITIRSMNILELNTKRFKHIGTLRVLLDNPETTEAVATTDVGAVAVAMVVVVVWSNSDAAGGNSGSDSNSNLLCVNYVYKFGYFLKLNPFFRFQIQVCSGSGWPMTLFHYCTSPTWKYNSTK